MSGRYWTDGRGGPGANQSVNATTGAGSGGIYLIPPATWSAQSFTMCGFAHLVTLTGNYALFSADTGFTTGSSYNGFNGSCPTITWATFSQTINVGTFSTTGWDFIACWGNGPSLGGYAWLASGASTWVTGTGANPAGASNEYIWLAENGFQNKTTFPGYLCGFRVWGYPLTLTELQREASQISPYSQRNLISYLPLNGRGGALQDRAVPGVSYTAYSSFAFTNGLLRPPVPEVVVRKRFSFGSHAKTVSNVIFDNMNC